MEVPHRADFQSILLGLAVEGGRGGGGDRELQTSGIFGLCLMGRLLSGNQMGNYWTVWLHCGQANPGSLVSSAHATQERRSAYAHPRVCGNHAKRETGSALQSPR